MVKFIIGAIIFGLIAIAIIVMVVINFTYRGVKKIRQEMEDNYYRSQKQKEQKEKNPFGDDYFKSSDSGSQQRAKQTHKTQQNQQSYGPQQESQKTTTRKTTTSSGVTIIDEREADKKIFNHDDGEYVEFEEV